MVRLSTNRTSHRLFLSIAGVPWDEFIEREGILTFFPSSTSFDLLLGAASPTVDEPCCGTLRFTGHWILTNVFVTQANILTSATSTNPYRKASHEAERSSTTSYEVHSFGRIFSPIHFRRSNARPVSCYALFQG